MPEPVIASVGASPIDRTDLRGGDLFSVALDDGTDWPVHVFTLRRETGQRHAGRR